MESGKRLLETDGSEGPPFKKQKFEHNVYHSLQFPRENGDDELSDAMLNDNASIPKFIEDMPSAKSRVIEQDKTESPVQNLNHITEMTQNVQPTETQNLAQESNTPQSTTQNSSYHPNAQTLITLPTPPQNTQQLPEDASQPIQNLSQSPPQNTHPTSDASQPTTLQNSPQPLLSDNTPSQPTLPQPTPQIAQPLSDNIPSLPILPQPTPQIAQPLSDNTPSQPTTIQNPSQSTSQNVFPTSENASQTITQKPPTPNISEEQKAQPLPQPISTTQTPSKQIPSSQPPSQQITSAQPPSQPTLQQLPLTQTPVQQLQVKAPKQEKKEPADKEVQKIKENNVKENKENNEKSNKEKKEKNNKDEEEEEVARPTDKVINPKYLQMLSALKMQEAFRNSQPYKHIVLEDFLTEEVLDLVEEQLNATEWYQKQNDVLTYEKTEDLKQSNDSVIEDLSKALYSVPFQEFLETLTGIKIYSVTECYGVVYKKGGHFLCHEDEIGHRRIAFILNLVPQDWSKEDGGTLDLFDCDRNYLPQKKQKSLLPKRNSLVMFELLPNITYYQISEVLGESEYLSIVGWFHGPPLPASQITPERALPKIPYSLLPTGFKLNDWINEEYLKPLSQKKYKNIFLRENSLNLPNFLLPERADAVEAALRSDETPWVTIGPPNRRHYDTLGRWGNENENGIILQVKQFLRSKAFITFVKTLTGLAVHEAFRGEVRRFKVQDYTQVLDNEETHLTEGLDVYLGFQEGEWNEEDGGYTTYQDTEDEILTLVPQRNSLSLVNREGATMHYVKYLSLNANAPRYDFQTSFVLASADDDEGDDYNDEGGDAPLSDFELTEDDED